MATKLSDETQRQLARARNELGAYCLAQWPPFEVPPHLRLTIGRLEAVIRGEIDRLMIFEPPRHGKSLLASTLWPAWFLGCHPERSVIAATYGQELSNDFGRRVRDFVSSDLHRLIFPNSKIVDDNAAAHRFGLDRGGSYFAVGVGGPITGRGADLLIIDDPQKNAEEAYSIISRRSLQQWYEQVAYTRLQPGGRIVLIQTRWHQADLAGWLLGEHASDNWTVVSLPALAEPGDMLDRPEGAPLWPQRFNAEALARIREAIGSTAWSALYQQRPVAAEGAIFRREWLRSYVGDQRMQYVVFSLDTAYKLGESNDYSVIAVWGENADGYYLLDIARERLDFPALKARVAAKAAFWHPHAVLIEDAASGQSLIQVLSRETKLPILPIKPLGDKESRASAVSPLFEAGRIFLPEAVSWLNDYVDELLAFPAASHDDQVDATTQALMWMAQQQREYSYRTPAQSTDQDHGDHAREWAEDARGGVWSAARLRFGRGAW